MDLEARKLEFMNRVATYLDTYPKEMLRAFYDYWSEHNEGGKKMKWEFQKVFNLKMRLNTWNNNNKKFNKTNGTTKQITATIGAAEILKNRR